MSVIDALLGDAFNAFGSKPNVPYLQPTSTALSQQTAIGANLKNLPDLQKLFGATNLFNQQEAQNIFNSATQGQGAGLFKQANQNIGDYLKGIIPDDVQAQVTGNAAARALGGGYGGSSMHGNLLARDLGLTSLDLQKYGVSALPGLMGAQQSLMGTQAVRPESFFVSPNTQIGLDASYNDSSWNRNWLAEQVIHSPDPTNVAYAQGISSDINGLVGAAGSLAGGAGGGGGSGGM